IHQNHVFRVRPLPNKLNSHFFAHYLQSAKAKQYFLRCAKRTTNLASINLTQLKALPVPVIPTREQERFEQSMSAARESQTDASNSVFNLLVASLSAHAFSGRLTADWREKHKQTLATEVRKRDKALENSGSASTRERSITKDELDDLISQPTDGVYSDLN